MILYPLDFHWEVHDDTNVRFSVTENVAHSIHSKYYSRGIIPPITARIEYAKALGASPKKLKRMMKNHMNNKKNSEKNQKIIDDIFLKFNVKPAKKKVLKAVKKL